MERASSPMWESLHLRTLTFYINILRPAHAQSSRLPLASPRPVQPTQSGPAHAAGTPTPQGPIDPHGPHHAQPGAQHCPLIYML